MLLMALIFVCFSDINWCFQNLLYKKINKFMLVMEVDILTGKNMLGVKTRLSLCHIFRPKIQCYENMGLEKINGNLLFNLYFVTYKMFYYVLLCKRIHICSDVGINNKCLFIFETK